MIVFAPVKIPQQPLLKVVRTPGEYTYSIMLGDECERVAKFVFPAEALTLRARVDGTTGATPGFAIPQGFYIPDGPTYSARITNLGDAEETLERGPSFCETHEKAMEGLLEKLLNRLNFLKGDIQEYEDFWAWKIGALAVAFASEDRGYDTWG